jgi:hypothetical protein
MRLSPGILAFLLASGFAHIDLDTIVSPGSPEEGDWVPFHTRDFPQGRLEYFYDRSRVHRQRDRLVARWKVLGSRDASVTLALVEIECRQGTFTERGTVLIDAGGRARELPRPELWFDHPIEANTSSDVFRRIFCR